MNSFSVPVKIWDSADSQIFLVDVRKHLGRDARNAVLLRCELRAPRYGLYLWYYWAWHAACMRLLRYCRFLHPLWRLQVLNVTTILFQSRDTIVIHDFHETATLQLPSRIDGVIRNGVRLTYFEIWTIVTRIILNWFILLNKLFYLNIMAWFVFLYNQ